MKEPVKIICMVCLLGVAACQQKVPPPTPPVAVNIQPVKSRTVLYFDNYPGTVQALNQVNIYPAVQGYITAIDVVDGAHVRKGQVLYEIDKRLYQAALDQADANLKVADGNYEQARQDADRYEYLNGYKAVASQLYDHAMIALKNADNQVKAAREAVKTAKTNLAYAVITAPFDGTVGFSQVRLGNVVTVGQTVLNTISSDNPMAVDILVNEKQLSGFEKLSRDAGDLADSMFTLVMPDNSIYPYPGKISVIDRAVNAQTGAIRIRMVFNNTENTLRAGMSGVLRVRNQEAAPQLVIPNKAIVEQMGEYFVFVVSDTMVQKGEGAPKPESDTSKAPKKYALQKKVIIGQTLGPDIIIKSGLQEGEKLIVDGVQLLHDGSKIALGGKKPAKEQK